MHVLVAEDSRTQARAIRSQLEEAGYTVTVCPDGLAAVEELMHAPTHAGVDVVVSDVVMPGLGGYDLCRRIKDDPALADIPVLLLTSLRDPLDVVHALEAGADGFLTKPAPASQLVTRIRSLLEARERRRSGEGDAGLDVLFMGHRVTVGSDRQQIVDVLMSSFEELVRANRSLVRRDVELADAQAELEAHLLDAEQSRERLDRSLAFSGVGTWAYDLEAGAMLWWHNVDGLYGHEPGEMGGDLDSILASTHPDDRDAVVRLLAAQREAPAREAPAETQEFEYRVVHPDGAVRWLKIRFALTPDAHLVGVVHDVTDHKEAQERLRRSEEALRGIFRASPDTIVLIDADQRFRFVSDAVTGLLGIAPADLTGARLHEIAAHGMTDAASDELLRQVGELLEGRRQRATVRLEVRHVDGRSLTTEQNLQALVSGDGRVEGVIGAIRDITPTVRLQAELSAAKEEAERANRAKSEFLSRMSHELRTPMNAVLGFAQLLEGSDGLDEDDRDGVQHILASGRHLLQLIDEVLDISRIEAGNTSLTVAPVDPVQVVGECIDLVRPLADERGIGLHLDGVSVPPVLADAHRLKQVLINLVSNAVKYNRPDGEVEVRWRADDHRLRLDVCDTGVGIAREDLDRLFVPFDRLGAEGTGVEGTGLGLSLSRHLVELMDGELTVTSEHGEGSVFTVSLPVAAAPEPVDEVAAPGGGHADRSGGQVVHIEDDVGNVELVRRVLRRRPGVELRVARDAERGLALVRASVPDLILLDLQLPDADGQQVLRQLRAEAATARVPIVVLSADASPGRREQLRAAGASGHLTKPFGLAELLDVIDTMLEGATDEQ